MPGNFRMDELKRNRYHEEDETCLLLKLKQYIRASLFYIAVIVIVVVACLLFIARNRLLFSHNKNMLLLLLLPLRLITYHLLNKCYIYQFLISFSSFHSKNASLRYLCMMSFFNAIEWHFKITTLSVKNQNIMIAWN